MISTTVWPASWKARSLLQHDAVAEVDVGRGRVDPELDPQRPALGQLLGQPPLGQGVDRPREQRLRAPSAAARPLPGAPSGQC